MRTKAWEDPDHLSSTVVQVRDDTNPMVWLHTNMGWVPISNAPSDWLKAVDFAEDIAYGYDLEECSAARAFFLAGED